MKNIKVLLIDDEPEFVEAVKERLDLRKIDADGALSGEEGITKMRRNNYDVILMDWKMPGICCSELVESIRQILPEAKIILITGYSPIKEEDNDIINSVYHCFNKPVKIRELLDKIQAAAGD